jgi:hypothetical protein
LAEKTRFYKRFCCLVRSAMLQVLQMAYCSKRRIRDTPWELHQGSMVLQQTARLLLRRRCWHRVRQQPYLGSGRAQHTKASTRDGEASDYGRWLHQNGHVLRHAQWEACEVCWWRGQVSGRKSSVQKPHICFGFRLCTARGCWGDCCFSQFSASARLPRPRNRRRQRGIDECTKWSMLWTVPCAM